MRLLVCVIILSLLLGCATVTKPKQIPISPIPWETDSFKPGVIEKKTVGEVMLEKTSMVLARGFIALSDWEPPFVRKGSIWICNSKLENGDYVCLEDGKAFVLVVIKPTGDLYGFIGGGLFNYGELGQFSKKAPSNLFKLTDIPLKGSFRQELIYNGRSKETIKITYREFQDDMARPAFFQDLSYDLSESKIIGFRGIMIEVRKATNAYIEFVIKGK